MMTFVFLSRSEADTDRLGQALAAALPAGTTIALVGTLGAGKTRLVQALAAALGVDRADVTSPTFVLCQQYQGRLPIYHLDAYRLADEDQFRELGTDELYESGGLTLIEWADKVPGALPDDYLEIEIQVLGPHERQFTFRPHGPGLTAVVERLAPALME